MGSAGDKTAGRLFPTAGKAATLLLVGVATFSIIELALRLLTHSLFVWGDWHVVDPVIGHVPRPGFAIAIPGAFRITIGEHGARSNGVPPPRERPLILAVGDSYTFGEGVSDDQTWPAYLEQVTDSRVINGGVTGFGLDQTVLRAENLVGLYHPDIVVVSFTPDDINRCEMSRFSGHTKPYFDLSPDGALELRPASAPKPFVWKRVLRMSLTLQILATDFLYSEGPNVQTANLGREIACRLMWRLATLAQGTKIVVLAQPAAADEQASDLESRRDLLACAAAQGLRTLDLTPTIMSYAPDERAALFDGHMSPAGNRVVADALATFLQQWARAVVGDVPQLDHVSENEVGKLRNIAWEALRMTRDDYAPVPITRFT